MQFNIENSVTNIWTEINFLLSIQKFFFEPEILWNTQMIHTEFMDIDTDIFPYTRPWTKCKSHKRRQNNCFLKWTIRMKSENQISEDNFYKCPLPWTNHATNNIMLHCMGRRTFITYILIFSMILKHEICSFIHYAIQNKSQKNNCMENHYTTWNITSVQDSRNP